MIKTLMITDKTPTMAIFCSTPIYFFRMKMRFSKIAPTVTPIQIH